MISWLFLISSILFVRVFPLAPSCNLLSVFLLLLCHLLVLYTTLLLVHLVQLIYLFLISLVISSSLLHWSQTCLLLLFYMDLIHLGISSFVSSSLSCSSILSISVSYVSFFLGSSIHLSYSGVSGIFVLFLFLLVLSSILCLPLLPFLLSFLIIFTFKCFLLILS